MKKSDLKTGMRVIFRDSLGEYCIVLVIDDITFGVFEHGHAREIYGIDSTIGECDIMSVYSLPVSYDDLLNFDACVSQIWERKEEKPIVTLDGVEYSESTLRSIIKKAHG